MLSSQKNFGYVTHYIASNVYKIICKISFVFFISEKSELRLRGKMFFLILPSQ
jgi:hypothetical protein